MSEFGFVVKACWHAHAKAMAAWAQILTPVQCAAFFHQCYPFGPDLLSLMAAAAADASPSDTRLMTGGFGTTAEWRQALVQPLSQLRCTA